MSAKRYPTTEGWVKAELILSVNKMIAEEKVKRFVTCGEPEAYEFGDMTQHGKKVICYYRRKPTEEPAPAAVNPEPSRGER